MKKRTAAIMGILLACTMFTGCGGDSDLSEASMDYDYSDSYDTVSYDDSYDSYSDTDVAERAADNGTESEEVTESEAATEDRKLIRTVNLSVETYDFDGLNAEVTKKVSELGGYVESSSVEGSSDSTYDLRYANYTLRIPKEKADDFITKIEGGSNVTNHTENQEDVTLNYVDINSKKESLKVEYDRLEELLEQAETVEDIIYIEDRMSDVRYQMDSIESQLRTYDNQIDYTTIYLSIDEVKEYTEPEPEEEELTVGERIAYGLAGAMVNISEFLKDLIVFVVVAIPYLLLVAIPALIIFLIVRAHYKKVNKRIAEKKAKEQENSAGAAAEQTAPAVPAEHVTETIAKGRSYTDMMMEKETEDNE